MLKLFSSTNEMASLFVPTASPLHGSSALWTVPFSFGGLMWIYLWALYFVPLIYMSVFVAVPYCPDDCGFVVEPEVTQVDSSSSILLSQDCFGYYRTFVSTKIMQLLVLILWKIPLVVWQGLHYIYRRRQWHPTPVLLPEKSHGCRSLVGCSPWSRKESDTTEWLLSLFTFMHWRRKWQPTPVFLPGESQGWRSLVGCRLWGYTESDTTEVT